MLSPDDAQAVYSDQVIRDVDLSQSEIASKEFYDCRFVRCSFAETTFRRCRFSNCTFEHCDLGLMRVTGSTFSGTRFEDSKAIGVNWTDASWPKARLSCPIGFCRCAISHSTFIGLSLPEIVISDCLARDVDFREANLARADLSHTDLAGSLFSSTDLTEADLSQAKDYNINAGLNVLKGARFSLPEAMSLLRSLDIVLVE
jgi:fluoroquinolone resistance protein